MNVILRVVMLLLGAGCVACAAQKPIQPVPQPQELAKIGQIGERLFAQNRRIFAARRVLHERGFVATDLVAVEPDSAENQARVLAVDFQSGSPEIIAEVKFDSGTVLLDCPSLKHRSAQCDGVLIDVKRREPIASEVEWIEKYRLLEGESSKLSLCTKLPPDLVLLKGADHFVGYVLSARSDVSEIIVAGHWRVRFNNGAPMSEALYRRCLVRPARSFVDRYSRKQGVERPNTISIQSPIFPFLDESQVFLALDNEISLLVVGTALRMLSVDYKGGAIRIREESVVFYQPRNNPIFVW